MTARIVKTPFTSDWFAGLLFEYQWQGSVLTYSIPNGTAYFGRDYSDQNEWDQWIALKPRQSDQFRSLVQEVDNYIEVSVIEVEDGIDYGDVRIAYTDLMSTGTLGYAYLPTPRFINRSEPSAVSGDIWLSPTLYNQSDQPGSEFHHIMMHELGHAVGLSHPFEANFPFPELSAQFDNFQYTVMSYDWHPNHIGAYPVTFMPMDILALQYLYGFNLNHSLEDTTYQFNDIINIQTIWDPNGYNTLDFSTLSTAVNINMNEGTFSSAGSVITTQNRTQEGIDNLALAFGTKIQEIIGSQFDDVIMGNKLDNTVYLGNGDDTYIYQGGNDIIYGGDGLNTIVLSGQLKDWTIIPYNSESEMFKIEKKNDSSFSLGFSDINKIQLSESSFFIRDLFQTNLLTEEFIAVLSKPDRPLESDILTKSRTIEVQEAQLYRIYLGVLDRIPDQEGFEWWSNRYEEDASYEKLIIGFYNSNEFGQLTDTNNDGTISNSELLDHLYHKVLGRDADTEGYNWWLSAMNEGSITHTDVIFNFTQSEEYVMDTLQTVGQFLWA